MAELWSNFAVTTLAAAMNTSTTTCDVVSGTLFPVPTGGDYFYCVLVEGSTTEIVKVTANSGGLFTVVRAQDGTSASAFGIGATVSHRVVSATLEGMSGGGGAVGAKYRSGIEYSLPMPNGASTMTQNAIVAHAFAVFHATTFDRIGLQVTTLAASSVVRLGIYQDSTGFPGTLLTEAGTVDSSTTGAKTVTINQALGAGVYWLAGQAEGGAPITRGIAPSNNAAGSIYMPISTTTAESWWFYGIGSQTPGSLATPFPTGAAPMVSSICPRIWLRAT